MCHYDIFEVLYFNNLNNANNKKVTIDKSDHNHPFCETKLQNQTN